MADLSRDCFTNLTPDNQLYEILRALIASSAGIASINGDTTAAQVIAGSAPLSAATSAGTTTISSTQAGAATAGYLSSTDWNTFNSKVNRSGDTMTGKLIAAADATASKLNIGSSLGSPAPTSLVDGDIWITNQNKLAFRSSATTINAAGTNQANTFSQPQNIGSTSNAAAVLTASNTGTREVATFTNTISATSDAVVITNLGSGNSLVINDDPATDLTRFVVSNTGRVGIGITPDATVALSVDTTGIKFGDNTVQDTAANYCLTLGHSSTTLAAGAPGTNAYFSNIFDLAPVGTYDRRQFNVHRNGVIVAASLSFYNGGGATPAGHSGATMSLYDVTANASVAPLVSYNVDGVASLNSATYLATGLNIPIVAGTLYNIYLQAGTFTTNPTSVRQTINLFIR